MEIHPLNISIEHSETLILTVKEGVKKLEIYKGYTQTQQTNRKMYHIPQDIQCQQRPTQTSNQNRQNGKTRIQTISVTFPLPGWEVDLGTDESVPVVPLCLLAAGIALRNVSGRKLALYRPLGCHFTSHCRKLIYAFRNKLRSHHRSTATLTHYQQHGTANVKSSCSALFVPN